ncbi:hypothetical protein NL108_018348 [Boleophthalmus pectinirostris]|nr:hypothetical protein NL108_018348 [Boleophthalmus pectinirostris]
MAWQNRIALDLLLAKESSVCSMFGTECCTYIPNNTSPDGKIIKALSKLKSLSEELGRNSGVSEDTWCNWLQNIWPLDVYHNIHMYHYTDYISCFSCNWMLHYSMSQITSRTINYYCLNTKCSRLPNCVPLLILSSHVLTPIIGFD